MNYINNFRYGEISRKNAGRFDAEYYNQGSFGFINMKTGSVGGASRRPPLKKLADVVGVLDIREFTISDSFSFIICLKAEGLSLYRFVTGRFVEIGNAIYPPNGDGTAITLTQETAREVRTCQYYNRMYFTHHTFKCFFIEMNASLTNFDIKTINILLNQDGKKEFYFSPKEVKDENDKELPGQEGRPVYYNPDDGYWYFKREYDHKSGTYKYEEKYEYSIKYPPIKGENAYISGYTEAKEDTLLTGVGHYPSVIACINDCLYFAATDNEPQVIWKSRVLGSSQYIHGYTADSMHDFITFQSVVSETKDLVEPNQIPKKDMVDSANNTIYETDVNGRIVYYGTKQVGETAEKKEIKLYWKYDENDNSKILYFKDFEMTKPYEVNTYQVEPYNKALQILDLEDPDKIMRTVCRVDFVVTDSCGDRIELNTGKNDRIMFIKPACERIIIGTTSSEETFPGNFSPVSNRTRDHYGDFGSRSKYNIEPVCMNSSLYFIQRTNSIREFYLYQGYMSNSDVTLLNHDAFNGSVVSVNSKNTPDPMIYIIMNDGTMRVLSLDKDNGIMSTGRWSMSNNGSQYGSFLSTAKMVMDFGDGNEREVLIALVKDANDQLSIAYFDEYEEDIFSDFYNSDTKEGFNYTSEIETTYVEVVDREFVSFGSFKKTNLAYIRCYNTGHVEVGDDRRQFQKSSYKLGNEDYRIPLTGTSKLKYSVIIRSVGNEPMNILAFGYEVSK